MTESHSRSATDWLLDRRVIMGFAGAVSGFIVGGVVLNFGIGIIFAISGFGVGFALGDAKRFMSGAKTHDDTSSYDERGGNSDRS